MSASRFRWFASAALCAALWGGAALAQEGPLAVVEIRRADWEAAGKALAAAGFDVAGVDRDRGALQVVATERELERLAAAGYAFDVVEWGRPLDRAEALSDYTSPTEMVAFLDTVVAAYPGLAQKVLLEDTLFEGQKVWALKITKDPDLPNLRPRFLLDASHHAREVMGPEIAKDCIEYLTSRYATDAQVRSWVDGLEIWVVPHVNPDGAAYVFSTESGWRKNRNPGCSVDNNRNYSFLWGACGGSSGACTNDIYRGPSPGSEPETQALVALTAALRPLFALSYHSYGQYILYPYGCGDPDERAVLDGVAQGLNAILVRDTGTAGGWATGPIWSTIYNADGGSVDTQYAQHGAYSFVIEVNSSSFQPDYATWRNLTVQRQRTAWQYFLDKSLSGPQVRGRVTDSATGLPVAAQVAVQEVTFTRGEAPRATDGRGIYHWLAASGSTLHITFTAPGYCTETRAVAVGSAAVTQDVVMTAPVVPGGLSAVAAGDNRIALTWSAAPGAAGYKVFRGLVPGGPYSLVQSPPAGQTSWTDTAASGAVTYYYVVRSTQVCGDSPDSLEVSATTTGACTQAPLFAGAASAVATPGATCSLDLAWAAAAPFCGGPTTYRVYRSTSAPFTPGPSNLVAAGLTGTAYRDASALANGATYAYIVRAADASTGTEDDNLATVSGRPLGPLADTLWQDDAGDTGTAKLSAGSPWSVLATGGKSGPKVYATGATGNSQCAALTTPELRIGSGAVLSFQSKYDLETGYDAGEVEVATGPAFDSWVKLATVNYPDALTSAGNACNFPTGGPGTAFCRTFTVPSYGAYSASLAGYAGQTVRLRWRLSTDSNTNGKGWWVDDLQVTHVQVPGSCSPGAAPLPAEAGTGSAPLTARRLAGDGVQLDFGPACGALDHAAYWGTGPVAGALSWSGAACALGTTGRAAVALAEPPPGAFRYFVVVGRDGAREGSFGTSFDNAAAAQRPEAQGVGSCDLPQVLGGVCP